MTSDPLTREQVHQCFVQEAPELLSSLEQELLSLQHNFKLEKVNHLMRIAHTLKGTAASMGLETIRTIAKSLEDIFRSLCHADRTLSSSIDALLWEGVECLRLALNAECTGDPISDREILDRTHAIATQIQTQMGSNFNSDAALPSAVELGYDVTKSLFELGVNDRLNKIAIALQQGDSSEIALTLRIQARVFLGLAEAHGLPGFGAIAQATLNALNNRPDQVETIAHLALADFRVGQADILAGDRAIGGAPSEALQQFADPPSIATPLIEDIWGKAILPSDSFLEHPTPTDPPALSPAEASPKLERTPKILIVDDSLTIRQTLVLMFEAAGYTVVQAEDGYAAIEQCQQHTDIQLIICDVEMPRMDGLEFLSFRQHDPNLAEIPVVILTSLEDNTHRSLALQLGATTYITKQYLPEKLLATASVLLAKHTMNKPRRDANPLHLFFV
jgi:CheY-like chemotaxis protein